MAYGMMSSLKHSLKHHNENITKPKIHWIQAFIRVNTETRQPAAIEADRQQLSAQQHASMAVDSLTS